MKQRPLLSRINIWFIYSLFTAVIFAAALYFIFIIKELRSREVNRMEIFAKAMQIQQSNTGIDSDTQDLLLSIFAENDELPMIMTDENKVPLMYEGSYRNIPEEVIQNPERMKSLLAEMESSYQPFEFTIAQGDKQLVFYDNSEMLKNIQYFPYFLGGFVAIYLFFSIWFMRTLKKTGEGYVWAGLAKETAHQIGTPLSSMIGWIEIMKLETPKSMGVEEIERDVMRLKTISERFSKIGSIPELNDQNLNETVQQNFDYLKSRISTKVKFTLHMTADTLFVKHNQILISWVIENLVKNAVDAMKGMGDLDIWVYEKGKYAIIDFKDSGCGMTKKQARNAFTAGFSTKKRGWGLGLSLARRVINEFHKGDLKIAQTEVNKGTIFRIQLRKN